MEKPPPLPPELIEEIDALGTALAEHGEHAGHAEVARKLEWLIDALVMRGQLPREYKQRAAARRANRSAVRMAPVADKYQQASPAIDCLARLPLCQARCCRVEVVLSAQDVRDGLPFEIDKPYVLRRDPRTKVCACNGADGTCTVYERRPAACRAYDCRQDPRVWIDFDARIAAPMPDDSER